MSDLSPESQLLLSECTSALKNAFDLHPVPYEQFREWTPAIAGLEMFENRSRIEVLDAYELESGYESRVGHRSQWIALQAARDESHFDAITGTTSNRVYYEVLHMVRVPCVHDFGKVLMRLETFGDKFSELFQKREIDFPEHPTFSDRYYVLASDEAKLRKAVTQEFLELICRRKLCVEIRGGYIHVTQARVISESDCVSLATLALAIPATLS
jgi:hypothetical protein